MQLMALGQFVFSLTTAPLSGYDRQTSHRWETQDRAGAAPATQWLGPGEDTLTLDGALMPELTGGRQHLETLRRMQAQGKAWILIDGQGRNQGRWVITSLTERGSHLLANGEPRRVDFSVTLQRYWDSDPGALGDLADSR
ncbi:MAG: hypothetical protein RLY86_117 [Pseudomonadota bacterium]